MEHDAREFEVTIQASEEIHELPNGWPTQRLQALLARLEMDEVGEEDAMEMATMALQDLEVDEASDRVLENVFGDRMRPGVRQNLIPDLRDDRPWEEFVEISQQSGIFEAVVLLQRAFPRDFGKPDAVSLGLRIETASRSAGEWLDASPPDAGLLMRILAAGMDDRAALLRLFDEPLAGDRFPEAAAILWHVERIGAAPPARDFRLISSHQWFDALGDRKTFTARAWPDLPSDEEA
jgi:hypothetical protein